MSQDERKIADTTGRFAEVARGGQPIEDARWVQARILLSNKRLVLALEGGQRTISLSEITEIGGRYDVNDTIAGVSNYVSLDCDGDVLLVTATDAELESAVHGAIVNGRVVLVSNADGEAGDGDGEREWQKARLTLESGSLRIDCQNGTAIRLKVSDVESIASVERTVRGERRATVDVVSVEDGGSVERSFAASERLCAALTSVLEPGNGESGSTADLDETEREVLMALYSGVSPFDIPDFLDIEVDHAETIYGRLVELNLVDEVRMRREVTLNVQGRNIASDVIGQS